MVDVCQSEGENLLTTGFAEAVGEPIVPVTPAVADEPEPAAAPELPPAPAAKKRAKRAKAKTTKAAKPNRKRR